jgi:hypothetical protein
LATDGLERWHEEPRKAAERMRAMRKIRPLWLFTLYTL